MDNLRFEPHNPLPPESESSESSVQVELKIRFYSYPVWVSQGCEGCNSPWQTCDFFLEIKTINGLGPKRLFRTVARQLETADPQGASKTSQQCLWTGLYPQAN